MKPAITAFKRSPDGGKGLARDMRVRWALEEVGQAYEVVPRTFAELKSPEHRALNPFGQIPTYSEGELSLFETGAIVLHLAEQQAGLLPPDQDARARAISWMFAAVSTIEPPIADRSSVVLFERDKPWFSERLAAVDARIRTRLGELSDRLGDAPWLEGDFSAGDLMTVDVLRRLKSSGLLKEYSVVQAYVDRAEARPAFRRAFEAQLAAFVAGSANSP